MASVKLQRALEKVADLLEENGNLIREREQFQREIAILKAGLAEFGIKLNYTLDAPVSAPKEKATTGTHLSTLGILPRGLHALRLGGINYVEELVLRTEGQLLKLPNFGQLTLEDIKTCLKHRGLNLTPGVLTQRLGLRRRQLQEQL